MQYIYNFINISYNFMATVLYICQNIKMKLSQ